MRWPGTIPAGTVCDAAAMTIDLLPTIAGLVGGRQPERPIDGEDIRPLLMGDETAASPHKALVFYAGGELQAVRSGRWKLHFEHDYLTVAGEPGRNGKPSNFDKLTPASITQSGIHGIASRHGYKVAHTPLALYDLEKDPGEQHNLATRHPDVVQRLASLAEPIRAELGDRLSGVVGTAIRPAGNVAEDR
jgi:arylsulfatase